MGCAGVQWPLQYVIKHYSQNTLRSLAGWCPVVQAWGLGPDDVIGLEASGGAGSCLQLRLLSVASAGPGRAGRNEAEHAGAGTEVVLALPEHAGEPQTACSDAMPADAAHLL